MTTRTFIQRGQAYGSDTVTIVAKIDGIEVFNGVVPNGLAPFVPYDANSSIGIGSISTQLFTFTDDVTFAGTKQLELTVSGGSIVMARTVGNYKSQLPGITYPDIEITETMGKADFYGPISTYTSGNVVIADPLSNVMINGVADPATPSVEMVTGNLPEGQWCRRLIDGDTLTATITIAAGTVA